MSSESDHIIFNTTQAALVSSRDPVVTIPSSESVVHFERDDGLINGEIQRVERQGKQLETFITDLKQADPFKLPLSWAYRLYKVADEAAEAPFRGYICLFNVVVALEWQPKKVYIDQLKAAFQSASDLLFDITDGYMAFGQVIFGGPELMPHADIQILASNRLHPRSWVAGLHTQNKQLYPNDAKYMPIRIGRGLWNDNRHGIIAWDEAESYRTIIHEWCHYALKMVDEYLETRPVQLYEGDASLLIRAPDEPPAPGPVVVMLKVSSITDSIMATTEGTSELVSKQWKKLIDIYPRIVDRVDPDQVRSGPRRVPVALPSFPELKGRGRLPDQTPRQIYFPKWIDIQADLIAQGLPADIVLDRCWLYIVKPNISASSNWPAKMIAQGTLEARIKGITRKEYRYQLYGAETGDKVILVAESRRQQPVVLQASVVAGEDEPQGWQNITPAAFPTIDVIPVRAEVKNQPIVPVRIRLRNLDAAAPDLGQISQVVLYPLGQDAPISLLDAEHMPAGIEWMSPATPDGTLTTLDGHVLVGWSGGQVTIAAFSQGGDGPQSTQPYPANPISAGSPNGQALLFMLKQKADDYDYDNSGLIKVVTTMLHGMPGLPPNGRNRSYTFSITSNAPLSSDFNPTLIIYHDSPEIEDEREHLTGDLRLFHWQDQGGWTVIPTYLPLGFRFAVAPLDPASAPSLLDLELPANRLRVEYYKVCWIPRQAPDA